MDLTSAAPPAMSDRIACCRRQQEAWSRLSVGQRLRPVAALRQLLASEWSALAAAVARDLGKTAEETLGGDVLPLADACRFLQREAPRLLRPRRVPLRLRPLWLWGQRDTVHRRPRGVVGVIGTWNYPLFLNGVQIVHALTAGNGIVWKPSEVAPASAAALAALFRRAGYPEDLLQVLEPTRQAGQELAEADVDHVVFTGSSATGRVLARTLGERLVSSSLELSGCDALFVLEDADVSLAARAAWFGATLNRGQTCLAARRAFVHRSIYSAFLDALRSRVAAAEPLRQALPSQVQQAHRLVREALVEGAHLLGAGAAESNGDPAACLPMVVVDARPEMALCREATFAPVMAVLPYDDLDDAMRMDAQCPYGLGASIFTGRPERGAALAARLRAGSVAVNDVIVPTAHPATPFGGRGASGWGVTQGREGLLAMTVPQVVSVRGGTYRPHYDLAAGQSSGQGEAMARGLLEVSHAPTVRQRLRGAWRLAQAVWQGGGR